MIAGDFSEGAVTRVGLSALDVSRGVYSDQGFILFSRSTHLSLLDFMVNTGALDGGSKLPREVLACKMTCFARVNFIVPGRGLFS